jgi:hypothetical protein
MFTLLRRAHLREGLLTEAPAFLLALLIAELFFKFHSFTLECLGFLATWYVISAALSLVVRPLAPEPTERS